MTAMTAVPETDDAPVAYAPPRAATTPLLTAIDGGKTDANANPLRLPGYPAAPAATAEKPKRERKKAPRPELGDRTAIRLTPGELHLQVDAAEFALGKAETVFQKNNTIVEIGRTPEPNFEEEVVWAQAVVRVKSHSMRSHLSRVVQCESFDARSGDYNVCDVPMDLAESVLQRASSSLPPLRGFLSHPTLRRDGSYMSDDGYDHRTGILVDKCGVDFGELPMDPTIEDARASLNAFTGLIAGFPFVAPEDRSVALSGMVSSVLRQTMQNCPMHAYTAPAAGSGKSTLVDLNSILTSGQDASCTATGATDEELEKRLVALYLAGKPVIAIDNVARPLGGEFLNIALSQARATTRILGKSEAPSVGTCALVCATGNSLKVIADMGRRVLVCSLDPKVARPELRVFDFDPKDHLRANRAGYVVAALTIVRAWHVAGRPAYSSPILDYPHWQDVRNALMWLGEADPAATMALARAEDPVLEELTALMLQWHEAFGTTKVTCRDVVEASNKSAGGGYEAGFASPDLREAVSSIAARGAALSSKALGKYLKSKAKRIVDGMRFESAGMVRGIETWALVLVDEHGNTKRELEPGEIDLGDL